MTGPILAVVAVFLYAALHSALATPWVKAAVRRGLGPPADRVYRFLYNLIGAVTLIPVLAIPLAYPGDELYVVPWPWSGLMLAGQLTAAGVVVLGLLQTDVWHFLGLRQLTQSEGATPPQMTTSGLYRAVRHPLYAAALVFLWLTPLMTTTLLALYASFSVYLYVGSIFEEHRLLAEFGEPYADYQRRVPRLIPRLRSRA